MATISNPAYYGDWVQLSKPWLQPDGTWLVEGTQFYWTLQKTDTDCGACASKGNRMWFVTARKDTGEVINRWIDYSFAFRTTVPYIQSTLNPEQTIYDEARKINTQFDLPANLADQPEPYFVQGLNRVPVDVALQ